MPYYDEGRELFDALSKCNLKKVIEVLDSGVDIDSRSTYSCKGGTALHKIIISIATLDDTIRNAQWDDNCNLDIKYLRQYGKIFNLLLKRGANVNAVDENGDTPIHLIAHMTEIEIDMDDFPTKFEDTEVFKLAKPLLEHGANVNAKNDKGETPAQISVSYALDDILIAHGAVVE